MECQRTQSDTSFSIGFARWTHDGIIWFHHSLSCLFMPHSIGRRAVATTKMHRVAGIRWQTKELVALMDRPIAPGPRTFLSRNNSSRNSRSTANPQLLSASRARGRKNGKKLSLSEDLSSFFFFSRGWQCYKNDSAFIAVITINSWPSKMLLLLPQRLFKLCRELWALESKLRNDEDSNRISPEAKLPAIALRIYDFDLCSFSNIDSIFRRWTGGDINKELDRIGLNYKLSQLLFVIFCSTNIYLRQYQLLLLLSALTHSVLFGLADTEPGAMETRVGVFAPDNNLKFLNICAIAALLSNKANLIPMQIRGPWPKGMNAIGWRDPFIPPENLSGSNWVGFGKYFSS